MHVVNLYINAVVPPCFLGEKDGWDVTECLENSDNVILLRGGLFAGISPDILCQ
jgi:hypothetical protein